MASEYLIKTVNGYEDYIKNHAIDEQVLNAYVMATQTAICTEHDIKYGVKVSNRAKEIINYLIKKQSGGTFAQLEDFAQENKTEFELINIYYKLLKMEDVFENVSEITITPKTMKYGENRLRIYALYFGVVASGMDSFQVTRNMT